jgi:hypothetical protein|eukprot:1303512-Prymnesium_polylepis.2
MSTVTYTAPRKADKKHAHAILKVDGSKYMIPKLPRLYIDDDHSYEFTGPLMKALYDSETFTPRVVQLIVNTLKQNPRYFCDLKKRIEERNSTSFAIRVFKKQKKQK